MIPLYGDWYMQANFIDYISMISSTVSPVPLLRWPYNCSIQIANPTWAQSPSLQYLQYGIPLFISTSISAHKYVSYRMVCTSFTNFSKTIGLLVGANDFLSSEFNQCIKAIVPSSNVSHLFTVFSCLYLPCLSIPEISFGCSLLRSCSIMFAF